MPTPKPGDSVYYVLDGQQRITSIYASLSGAIIGKADYSKLFINLNADESQEIVVMNVDGIKEVTVDNICVDTGELPLSSILSYKGLECKHVILVLNKASSINPLELYVGMTRAIVDLKLLVLN